MQWDREKIGHQKYSGRHSIKLIMIVINNLLGIYQTFGWTTRESESWREWYEASKYYKKKIKNSKKWSRTLGIYQMFPWLEK